MDWKTEYDIASERASKYAPPPRGDPVSVGIMGAVIVGVTVMVFEAMAGMRPGGELAWAEIVTVALGFAVPFGWLKFQARQHTKALVKEHDYLMKNRDA
jgi:hypothetical protein